MLHWQVLAGSKVPHPDFAQDPWTRCGAGASAGAGAGAGGVPHVRLKSAQQLP